MSFDIAFYDAVVDMKKAATAAAQGGDHGAEHASAGEDVFTLLGDWQEDTLDIQAFLQARNVDAAVPAPAPPAPAAGAASGGGGVGRLPTPVIVRPSNLNLTQGVYNGAQAASHHQQQQQHMSASSRGGQVSPLGGGGAVHQVPEMPQVSPQHSPYGQSATMFDYGGAPASAKQQQQQHRAVAAMMAAAQSPRTPVFGSYSAAVSAAAAPGMLGGGNGMHAVVKHDEDSCSSSLDSYQGPSGMQGGSGSAGASRKRSSTASVSSTERDPDAYRAKRERNNVAVRKSREKKKQREQETEKRVKELSDENASLVGKVELLTKQLATIKSLFAVLTKSLPPEHRRRAELELDSLNVGRFYEQSTTPPPPRGGN